MLVTSLKDLDDEVRAKSAGALGKLGDRRAVTYLLKLVLVVPMFRLRTKLPL